MSHDLQFVIITPSFNQAEFISKTLASVADQAQVYTHLVLDGGSTDDTVAILKKSHSKKLRWQSKPDKGQTDAINKGLKQALKLASQAKLNPEQVIVAYLNSDDYYLANTLSDVAKAFSAHPSAQWLVGDAVIVDEQNQIIQEKVRQYKKWWRQRLSWWVLGVLNPMPQPAVFFRLSAVKKVGLFSTSLYYVMDYEYWLRLWRTFGRPIQVEQVLAAFRIHSASKGGTGYLKQFIEQYQTTTRYFSNPLVLLMQRLHNFAIVMVYKLLK